MRGCNHPSGGKYDRPFAANDGGFTLIELLVTISVLAILIVVAVPSFISVINSNRLAAQANDVVAALQLARSEAVRRNTAVTVCRSNDGSTCVTAAGQGQLLTFIDANANNTAQAAEILRTSAIKSPLRVSNSVARIAFRADGLARTAANALLPLTSIVVCLPTTQPAENRRVIELSGGSRVSTRSVDGGGICP